ncbi:MAG: EAL domain-containing protein [Anaerovoracaceae bacterium]
MRWNMAPEWVSGALMIILLVYIYIGISAQLLRDRMFRGLSLFAVISIITNLASTYSLYNFETVGIPLATMLTELYYITTAAVPLLYLYYTIILIHYEFSFGHMNNKWHLINIPYVIYLMLVLTNPITKLVFYVDENKGYVQGPLTASPYVVFFICFVMILCLAFVNYKKMEKRVLKVVLAFPCLAFIFLALQLIFPDIILTGTASFATVFILYLYLQNQNMTTDELTGLLNRKMLVKSTGAFIRSRTMFTVIMLDLDNFKGVNGKFGNVVGDELLVEISNFLLKNLSPQQLFRYGGDKFAIIIKGEDYDTFNETIMLINNRIKEPWMIRNIECSITTSIVSASFPEDGDNVESILGAIDYANTYAKTEVSGGLIKFVGEMKDVVIRREIIAAELSKALLEDSFEVYFQPIWCIKTKRFIQAEALLRMNSKILGRITPDEFIPVAETTGTIIEITYRVIEKACQMLNRLDDLSGVTNRMEYISVNFPYKQFLQADGEKRVRDILKKYQIDPSRLKIEITERVLVNNLEAIESFMENLHKAGTMLCLDDFGVGYSNFEMILKLPFSVVKLDKSIVCQLWRIQIG